MSGYGVWRRPRSIPRLDGALPDWRKVARHQLSIHGGLRGSWLLLSRDRHSSCLTQGRVTTTLQLNIKFCSRNPG